MDITEADPVPVSDPDHVADEVPVTDPAPASLFKALCETRGLILAKTCVLSYDDGDNKKRNVLKKN